MRFLRPALKLLTLVILTFAVAACGSQATRYESVVAEQGDIRDVVPATGRIRPIFEVAVRAPRAGRLVSVAVRPDDRVRRGQLLALVAPAEAAADLDAVTAELNVARAELGAANELAADANRVFEARKQLVDRGLYSESALVTLESARDVALARRTAAASAVQAAEARVRRGAAVVAQYEIRSPADGYVLSHSGRVGELVSPGDETPLFVIADVGTKVQVRAEVAEPDIGRISLTTTAVFRVDAYPRDRFRGRITQILRNPKGEGAFTFYEVLIESEDPDQKLFPGMAAAVEFVHEDIRQTLRIPIRSLYYVPQDYVFSAPTALANELRRSNMTDPKLLAAAENGILFASGHRRVFVMQDGRWERRQVRIGGQNREYVEVLEGIQPGEAVIVGDSDGRPNR